MTDANTTAPPSAMRAAVNDHLANERTHLAYVGTAVSLFASGITLHQFSWFIAEHRDTLRPGTFAAGWRVGFGMVLFGIVVALWSAFRFDPMTRDIDRGIYRPNRIAMLALSLGIPIIGATGAVWLLWR
ncbi:YidH family protein [Povalibacter sp.]|uniref:YidH family protein n=1 Tax=Povalibacter sp. TaxID=1962978 RepID=UPI002F3FF7D6